MSDNMTEFDMDTTPERGGLFKKLAMMIVSAVLVCAILVVFLFSDGLNMDQIRRWVKYMNVKEDGTYGSYTFDSHSSNQYAALGNGLVVASVGGLNTFDENGEERIVIQNQMELPQLQVHGNLAMAYDVGGKSLIALHSKNGEVLNLKENRAILDADLSEGGYICLSSSASGYKSVLSVYNAQQNLVYRWLSSTTYIPICSISPNGKYLAAVALGQDQGVFESSVYLFKTDAEEIQQTISLGNELIYELQFVDDNTICTIGESSVQFWKTSGEEIGVYSYSDRYLKDYHDGGDGFLTLSLNMYRAGNRYSVLTVDEKGKQIAATYIGQEILDISACGKYVAVLTPQGLTIYTQNLEVYRVTVETGNATSVVMRSDGSVLLLGNGRGRLYIP